LYLSVCLFFALYNRQTPQKIVKTVGPFFPRQKILSAEAAKQQVVLAAEANQQKLVLDATGTRDAKLLEAQGILAVGQAEAEAQKLKLSAYAVAGPDAFVKIEIAKAFANAHQNVKGYLPMDMNILTLGRNFLGAVDKVMDSGNAPPPSPAETGSPKPSQ
jgi:hypothetical protein